MPIIPLRIIRSMVPEAIHNDLTANSICSEITIDTTGEHGIFRNASSLFRAQRASCFFKSVFCNNCSSLYTTDSIPSNCSNPLSIDEHNFGSTINVYPNPFETSFSIDGIVGTLDVTLYNCFGQVVYKDEIVNGAVKVDLLPGLYFLTIRHLESTKIFTTKLIKN